MRERREVFDLEHFLFLFICEPLMLSNEPEFPAATRWSLNFLFLSSLPFPFIRLVHAPSRVLRYADRQVDRPAVPGALFLLSFRKHFLSQREPFNTPEDRKTNLYVHYLFIYLFETIFFLLETSRKKMSDALMNRMPCIWLPLEEEVGGPG